MTGDKSKFVRETWQSQREEAMIFTAEELRVRSERFAKQLRRRNSVEYGAAAVIVLVNGLYLWLFRSMLMRVGSALMIAGVLYVVVQLRRQGSAGSVQWAAAPSLDFLIGELKRQRDLLWKVWEWYLLPLFPGMAVFLFGMSQMRGTNGLRLVPERSIVLTVMLVVVSFALIAFANRRMSRRLQGRIKVLEGLRR
jgi:apolipoprotein N-acyltransferase